MRLAVLGLSCTVGPALGQQITFETPPLGVVLADDEPLPLGAAYIFDGVEVRFGFDTDGDLIADRSAVLEQSGLNGSDDGFRNNGLDEWDVARPGFETQLGAWLLRKASDWQGDWSLIVTFTPGIASVQGEVWDIDGSPAAYDSWRVIAYDQGSSVLTSFDSPVHQTFDSSSLDGSPWVFNAASPQIPIEKIEIRFTGVEGQDSGFAFNNFGFTTFEGPTLLTHQPDHVVRGPEGVPQVEMYWSEPVLIGAGDIEVIGGGQQVPFSVEGSGTRITTLTFTGMPGGSDTGGPVPLLLGDYEVIVRDTARALSTNAPIDGDGDGNAGGDLEITLTHICGADLSEPYGLLDLSDITTFITLFVSNCDE